MKSARPKASIVTFLSTEENTSRVNKSPKMFKVNTQDRELKESLLEQMGTHNFTLLQSKYDEVCRIEKQKQDQLEKLKKELALIKNET